MGMDSAGLVFSEILKAESNLMKNAGSWLLLSWGCFPQRLQMDGITAMLETSAVLP